MRKLAIAAAFIFASVPTAAQASEAGDALGFHRCYHQIPARPVLRNETRLVMVAPGYWEDRLRPSSGWVTPKGPRAVRTTRMWHEPVFMKITEQAVIDPGRATLLRSDNCWPD